MSNQNNEDEFMFQQFQKETKQKIFQMTKTYLQHTETINPILIYIVILIQSLQILWFSIHPQLQFLNNPFLLNYFRSALSYVNFQSFLHSNNQLLLSFVIIASTLVIIFVGLVIVSIKITISHSYIKKPEYLNTLNKIVTYLFILFNTILTIPVYNVSIITLYCDKNSIYHNKTSGKCYDSIHIAMCIFAAINLFVILMSSLIYWFLFYFRDPFYKGYYSLANNLFRLGKLVIKLLPPAYFLIDVNHSYLNIYVGVSLVLVFAYIAFFRINSIHNFYQNYFYCQFYMELIILWFFANTALSFQIKSSGMNFIQSLICSLLFAYAICVVESALQQKFFQKNLFETVKKQDRQKFIYILINLLFKETTSQEISPVVYIQLLNSSLNICSIKISKLLHKTDLKNQEIIDTIRQVLLNILNKYFEQGTTVTLKLIKCCILFQSGLKIVSLHQISKIRPDKLSLYEQFMIYHFKATRNLFQQNQMRKNEENLNQITTYLEFIEQMNQFQTQIQLCTKNNQQFWEQLCEDLPSINKVFNLAQRSTKYYNKIEQIFKKVELIYPENLPSLLIYFSFLDQVRANYKQFRKIKEKLCVQRQRQLHKQNLQIEVKISKIKFKPNQQMCVVHVSTFLSNIGTILNCNSNVKKFLGYEKSDLISQKVTKIMPKIYAQIHDQFIKNYLLKADQMKLPTQKTVFPLKKNLMIVQTFLAVKIFPNIVNGFQLVGFLKQAQKKQNQITFMLNLKTLQIEGMTQGFVKLAGNRLKLQELQKQSLKLSHVFPQIKPSHVFKMGQKISTMLRFSDCTDKLIDLEEASSQARKKLQKNISLQLVSINYYSNCQIGIFSVSPLQQIISLQDANNLKTTQKNTIKHNFKNSSIKKSIANIEDQSQQQVSSIQRKIQDFLGSKLQLFSICIIKIIFLLCFLALCIASTVINVLNINENVQHTRLLQQINLANNITILQGKILTNNKLIVQKSNDQIQWNIVKHHYMQQLKQLQNTTTILFQKANQRKSQKLIINQFNLYKFHLISISGNQYSTTNLHYFDGILQIIFIGFDMLSKNISLFNLPVQQHLQQSLYFIQQNMKQMLPMVAQKTIQSYSTYFYQKLSQELQNQIYLVIQKTTIFLVIYLILCLSIKKFSQFNKIIITIYNSILKWDAYQLFYKCNQFRIRNFDNNQSNFDKNSRNSSNLFRLLPKNIFVKLTQPKNKDKINQSQNNSKDSNLLQQRRSYKSNNTSQMSYSLQEKKKIQRKSQKIQQNQKKIDLINIKLQQSYTKRYSLIFLLLLCLILINFASSFLRNDYNKKLLEQRDYSIKLGKYSKSCLFTLYYSTQVIKGNTQYMRLYKQQLQYFYNRSNQIAIYLSNNQEYIRQVYKQIQILHSLVNDQISTINSTTKQKLITQAKQNIFQISDKLNTILTNNQQISLTTIYNFQRIMRIIKICLDIIITIIFCKLVLIHLIKPAQNQLQYSFNMLKMLPTWLISKNKNIRNIISLQNLDKEHMEKSKIGDQQSAASLMQSAVM